MVLIVNAYKKGQPPPIAQAVNKWWKGASQSLSAAKRPGGRESASGGLTRLARRLGKPTIKVTCPAFAEFVTMKGEAYFFPPSMSFLLEPDECGAGKLAAN
ncbi:MAG: hypothetical protein JWL59_542 [Chthoniobacteraceae bacterium]|nr:hypothetical protein [Chthoniobacteraceae bacterium]